MSIRSCRCLVSLPVQSNITGSASCGNWGTGTQEAQEALFLVLLQNLFGRGPLPPGETSELLVQPFFKLQKGHRPTETVGVSDCCNRPLRRMGFDFSSIER